MIRGPAVSFWGLVAAALVAVVAGQAGAHRGFGPPLDHKAGDHNGGPPLGGQHGRYEGEPEICSADESHDALEASSAYITCAEIDYPEFLALVQADIGLMEGAASCFNTKIESLVPATDPSVVDVGAIFEDCVNQVANTDGTNAAAITAEFLNKMLGPNTKICECLPDYLDQMPPCGQWNRFHHFGYRVEALCDTIKQNGGVIPVDGELQKDTATMTTTEAGEKQDPEEAVKVAEENDGDELETSEKESGVPANKPEDQGSPPRFPNNTPPCPPGQEQHPADPSKCQPPQSEEFYEEDPNGVRNDRGPPEGAGGGFGLGVAVLGVVGVGSLIGVGGVWLWGKFQSGTRQPGVRYMATGLENDIGTELGPFGREFA